jgi:hypothetical protein
LGVREALIWEQVRRRREVWAGLGMKGDSCRADFSPPKRAAHDALSAEWKRLGRELTELLKEHGGPLVLPDGRTIRLNAWGDGVAILLPAEAFRKPIEREHHAAHARGIAAVAAARGKAVAR